jgi:uncharacterized protein YcsI (UPF0317 family)
MCSLPETGELQPWRCAETGDAWMGVSRTSSVASELSSGIQLSSCLPHLSLHNASLECVLLNNRFVVRHWSMDCWIITCSASLECGLLDNHFVAHHRGMSFLDNCFVVRHWSVDCWIIACSASLERGLLDNHFVTHHRGVSFLDNCFVVRHWSVDC